MISRKTLFTILLGIVGIVIITSRMSILPARVVIINQSGAGIGEVVVTSDSGRKELGHIDNGATRRVGVPPTASLRLTYRRGTTRVWSSPKGLSAGQSLVLYVTPENVVARDRLGGLAR
jgi:hypothetical protein